MVCLHTCLQFLCAEAKLVMRGYYIAEKTSYLPPPLLSSPLPLSLSFYDNIAGKWCPCGGFFYRCGSEWSQCAHWCSWVWPWNISGVDQQQNICTTANVGFVSFLGSAYFWHSAAHQLSNLFVNFDLLFILSFISLMYFKIRFLLKKWWYNTLVLVLRQFLSSKINLLN